MSSSPHGPAHDESLHEAPAPVTTMPVQDEGSALPASTEAAAYTYEPSHGLMWATVILLAANVLFDGMAILANLFVDIPLLQDLMRDVEPTEQQMIVYDSLWGMIGLGTLGSLLGAVIVFCLWANRTNKNARAMGAVDMRFTPGWTVGYFFIPILNLFRPYQAFAEMWQASDPDTIGEPGGWQATGGTMLLGAWWFTWIVANIGGNLAMRTAMGAETLEDSLHAVQVDMASSAVFMVAGLLAIAVVYRLHKRQEARAARLGLIPSDDPFA